MKTNRKTLLLTALLLLAAAGIALGSVLLKAGPNGTAAMLAPRGPGSPPAAAEPSWYRLYFTAPAYPDSVSAHRGGLDEKLAAFISTAKSRVDVAIYQLDAPLVVDALAAANSRGARVRMVTDIDILNDPRENPAFLSLKGLGIAIVAGNPSGIMHDKFVVVDGRAVWTGSWNFTTNDSYRYDNTGVAIDSAALAASYSVTFNKMFEKGEFGGHREAGGPAQRITVGGAPIEVWYSPEDRTEGRLVELIAGARKKIDFLAFSFTDDDIGAAVLQRATSGVAVRGVFEKTGSLTKYSEYGAMKKAGMEVRQDGNAYLMHIKAFIVDGRYVAFGSYNFTKNAKTENDENLLVVDDPGMARSFEAEFERVWARAGASGN